MGVRVIHDKKNDIACLYDSVTMWAFGPVIHGNDNQDAAEVATEFGNSLPCDARIYTDSDLGREYSKYVYEKKEQTDQEKA